MNLKNSLTFLTGLYIAVLVWWLSIYLSDSREGIFNAIFSLFWGLFLVFGGGVVCLLVIFHVKYKFKFDIKLSLVLLGIGVCLWGLGNVIWALFSVLFKIEVPFPSVADVLFTASYPVLFYGFVGIFYPRSLKYAHGVFELLFDRRGIGLLASLIVPSVILLSLNGYVSSLSLFGLPLLKVVLNIYYLGFDLLIIGVMFLSLFTRRYLKYGGVESGRNLIYLVFTCLVLTIADIRFLLLSLSGTYFNGDVVDILYVTAFFFAIVGMFQVLRKEFPMTFVEDTYNITHVVKMTYLKEFGLNFKGLVLTMKRVLSL